MRHLWAMIFAFTAAWPALADDVQDVISNQIEAFEADDFSTAFTFASPMIRDMFGTPERFGMMVQRGYPMVWRPADVQFVGQETRGAIVYQKVLIRDQNGGFHTLEYEMIPAGDGWQINGVRFIKAPDASA